MWEKGDNCKCVQVLWAGGKLQIIAMSDRSSPRGTRPRLFRTTSLLVRRPGSATNQANSVVLGALAIFFLQLTSPQHVGIILMNSCNKGTQGDLFFTVATTARSHNFLIIFHAVCLNTHAVGTHALV